MKPNPKVGLTLSATMLAATLFVTYQFGRQLTVHAQSNQEVPLYKIADIPNSGIYKMVHHGCALYIIRESHGTALADRADVATVSIATGEGCK
jgi:hypothetical protein